MISYILRRLAFLPLVMLGVTILLFALLQFLTPEMRASLYIKDPRQLSALEEIIREHRLRDPLPIQYVLWLKRLLRADLGYSETAKMPVRDALVGFFPASAELALLSFLPIFFVGLWLGTLSAAHRDKTFDHLSRIFSILGYSLPSFVLGLVLLMVFYGQLGWFPPGRLSVESDLWMQAHAFRRFTGFLTLDSLLNANLPLFWDALRHLILPAVTLAYIEVALLVRIVRSSMLEELGKDYVRTARAKGLPESMVIKKHARRNALIPAITLSSILLAQLMAGVVITETVFNYPGLGRWGAFAAQQLDVPAVMGFALCTAGLFVLGNLAADLLYAWLDPRIRY